MAAAARARGLDPVVVPLIAALPPDDPAPLDRAVRRLGGSGGTAWRPGAGPVDESGPETVRSVDAATDVAVASGDATDVAVSASSEAPAGDGGDQRGAGDVTASAGYAWVVVTSATAVRVLAGRVSGLPAGVRVAAVGDRTARAARAVEWSVDLVPEQASAADLVAVFPATDGTVLFPRSDIAATTVVDGLRARGIDVDDVVAYRTVGTGDDRIDLDPVPAAVLVTSGSVAREIARRMAPLDAGTLVACIGPGTAADARAAGLPVHVVSAGRSAEALLDAVVQHLRPEQTVPTTRTRFAPESAPEPEPPTGRPS